MEQLSNAATRTLANLINVYGGHVANIAGVTGPKGIMRTSITALDRAGLVTVTLTASGAYDTMTVTEAGRAR
jgi:hypothetical protein